MERRLLLGVMATLVVITVSNNSAGALAQPAIAEAFRVGPAEAGWVVFGFGAAFAVATALWGGLARRFGLGPSLAVGVLMLAAGSLAAVVAPSLPLLVAARMLQGIGAGAIPTLGTSLIALRFEGPARVQALGTIVAAVGLGLALGPLLGGLALELVGWQGALAFGIVSAPMALILVREATQRDRDARLDVAGALLVTVAVLALTFLVNRLPVDGPSVLVVAAGLAIPVAGLALLRRRHAPGSFVPSRIVTDPAFRRIVVLGFIGMTAMFGTMVLVPVAAARAHDLRGIALGLLILPMAVVGALTSIRNGAVQGRLGRPGTTALSLAALAASALLIGLAGAATPPVAMAIALLPLGVGFGLLQAPLVNELTVAFTGPERPIALGLYNLAFFLGGSLGGAFATALVGRGLELPFLGSRAVPGFSSAELLLAVAPAIAVVLLVARRTRTRDVREAR